MQIQTIDYNICLFTATSKQFASEQNITYLPTHLKNYGSGDSKQTIFLGWPKEP
jgi:hypothetical protein